MYIELKSLYRKFGNGNWIIEDLNTKLKVVKLQVFMPLMEVVNPQL